MNILVICHFNLYQDLGSSFVHSQIREYVTLGHRVRAIILAPMGRRGRNGKQIDKLLNVWQADGVELYDLRYFSLGKYATKVMNNSSAMATIGLLWKRILKNFQPDVIHAHTLDFGCPLGAMMKAKLRCPLVVTTHGSDTTVLVNAGRTAELFGYCKGADVVVAVSKALEARLKQCKTETEIRVIHNGYCSEGLTGDAEKVECSCLQVSNLIELKQIPVTIRAFEKIYRKHPKARLTIIGQGPDRNELEQLCEDLGISNVVTFTGQLQHQDVIAHMARTQFYIQPSVREGLPISYLEAMGMRCVIVGTATEGIAEIVEHEVNGILVQPGDYDAIAEHVCTCIADEEKATRIAEEGKKTAELLTWHHNAQKLVSLFEELAANNKL